MDREIRVGVFGTWRGRAYMKALKMIDGVRVTALCDKMPQRNEEAKALCEGEVEVYDNFDEFIDSGKFDALLLCNYFHEHAQYAIPALERGIHIFSETMAASTMALCVELCRAVEKSGCIYMLGENYPFSRSCLEMKRLYEGGTLGKVLFAEGEYVHPMSPEESWRYNNPEVHGEYHWRRHLPVTYYSSHALAPLIYMTGALPRHVVGMAAPDTEENIKKYKKVKTDAVGVMLVQMDNGAIFRVNGSSNIGPKGNWYRLGCTGGGVETVRGNEKSVRLAYHQWSVPESAEVSKIYEARWASDADKADKAGHGGGDYWVVKEFIDAIRSGRPNKRLDVYHAVAMSAVAILGWRSVLQQSKRFDIPDFTKESEREKWENDNLTPFPSEDAPNTLPFNSRDAEKAGSEQ